MRIDKFFSRYQRVVVFDTEFTTWEGAKDRGWSGEDEHREIFQISAAKVEFEKKQISDTFERYVYPRRNPLLSDFAQKLTGISQQEVDRGVDFNQMYHDFLTWSDELPLCSYARGTGLEGEGEIIQENIDLYKLDVPYEARRFINLVPIFRGAGVAVERFSSGELHRCFDIEVPGTVHDAIHDSYSIAVALIALKGEVPGISSRAFLK